MLLSGQVVPSVRLSALERQMLLSWSTEVRPAKDTLTLALFADPVLRGVYNAPVKSRSLAESSLR